MRRILSNRLDEIPGLMDALNRLGVEHGVAEPVMFSIKLCVDELVTNAITYGYAPGETGTITVVVGLDADKATVEVADDGRPFDPLSQARAPDLDAPLDERAPGGLGLHLVKSLATTVAYRYQDRRNIVTLTHAWPGASTT